MSLFRRITPAMALAFALWPRPAVAAGCVMQEQDAVWSRAALRDWDTVRREDLRIVDPASPWIIFLDNACAWGLKPDAEAISGEPHAGKVTLPDGTVTDVKVLSFAGTYGADDRPYMVMALPSIWRSDPGRASDPQIDRLTRSVFMHEMTHTQQAHTTGLWLKKVETTHALPPDLDDDIIQKRFDKTPGFLEAYEAERDLFFAAAAESDPDRRRKLAAEGLDRMKTRRAKYFVGDNAVFADLEDLFLNMEGVGNWAAYRLSARETATPADAVALIRGGRKHWSQDEGLALFLVIDALSPGWQSKLFGSTPASVIDLLSAAVR